MLGKCVKIYKSWTAIRSFHYLIGLDILYNACPHIHTSNYFYIVSDITCIFICVLGFFRKSFHSEMAGGYPLRIQAFLARFFELYFRYCGSYYIHSYYQISAEWILFSRTRLTLHTTLIQWQICHVFILWSDFMRILFEWQKHAFYFHLLIAHFLVYFCNLSVYRQCIHTGLGIACNDCKRQAQSSS